MNFRRFLKIAEDLAEGVKKYEREVLKEVTWRS